MKALITLVMFAGLALTAGAQAAAIPDFPVKSLGGTGFQVVSGPSTTPLGVAWTHDAGGQVNGADITWTPVDTANYKITVEATGTGSEGDTTVSGTADTEQTDHVVISPSVGPLNFTSVEIAIAQQ